eukprot:TRINITY_DN248_c0_g1_i1.p1 TRINITY_DN248_c0_g1~~TRINITY_DN248_c0_g1_i1.p1  ORF type:complete len:221 (-),score=56.70 TRINITY_DN248_c0_g1_i1:103-765(-)
MGRLRYERRVSPVPRILNLLKTGVLNAKPVWFDAVRLFPSAAPGIYSVGTPAKLVYLEDRLIKSFNRRYKEYFGEHYVGVTHMSPIKAGDNHPTRHKQSYRNMFIQEQAALMRRYPEMTEVEAFAKTVPYMEEIRKQDRNKTALMSRYLLDKSGKGLNESILDIQRIGDPTLIDHVSKVWRRRIKAERVLLHQAFSFTQMSSKQFKPRVDEDGKVHYDDD